MKMLWQYSVACIVNAVNEWAINSWTCFNSMLKQIENFLHPIYCYHSLAPMLSRCWPVAIYWSGEWWECRAKLVIGLGGIFQCNAENIYSNNDFRFSINSSLKWNISRTRSYPMEIVLSGWIAGNVEECEERRKIQIANSFRLECHTVDHHKYVLSVSQRRALQTASGRVCVSV